MEEKDSNISTEAVKKLSESLWITTIAGKDFKLREMKIGRLEKFFEKLNDAFKAIQGSLRAEEEAYQEKYRADNSLTMEQWDKLEDKPSFLTNMDITAFLSKYSTVLFEEFAKIFNFIYSYKNDDSFEPVDAKWIGENIALREIKIIVEAVTEQNNIKGALPFLRSSALDLYKKYARTKA